ncbi:TetR family transcriptional regulator [Cohnella sp. CIP 111063]|uniref:TetR/AcrR family transcriptional regulator n=1 Tax=unclassified Cohnella TaxID=2636738 RepID=UPI000B8BF3A2|nr:MULTISPECIES: TetR/AcrR family transcriptional regulator [unclassified Cohnella]OXS59978.1 TetR family transcriptional regulator [Cohnella sp. CIP 111063]PRX72791.1 TetR family transcriptional regulator [Cohnella sp. SGD-V74]
MSSDNILDRMLASAKQSKKETARQQRILQSAVALFAEKGYANTSTSEIAKHSGVAEGTIFRHYGTKENLLLAVIVPFLKESLPAMAQEVFEEVNPAKQAGFDHFLRALFLNRLRFFRENKEIFRVVVKEFVYRDELRNELMAHIQRDIVVYMFRAMDYFKAKGDLPDLPNERLLKLIFPYVFSQFVIRFALASEEPPVSDEEEAESVVRFVLRGIEGYR